MSNQYITAELIIPSNLNLHHILIVMYNIQMKIDGKEIAAHIFENLTSRVKDLSEEGVTPHLAVILVGDDESSKAYVRQKELKIGEIGAAITVHRLKTSVTQEELLTLIQTLNHEPTVHGIIIQRPLPGHIDGEAITNATEPSKDVDGFCTESPFDPPIAIAVWKILKEIHRKNSASTMPVADWLKSHKVVIMGKGKTAGLPIGLYFKKMGVPFTVIDSSTQNRDELIATADILISAVGKRGVLKGLSFKHGAVIIGVGMFKNDEGKLEGDYIEDDVINKISFYTTVPGGVGPVNVAMLLVNLVQAAETNNSY